MRIASRDEWLDGAPVAVWRVTQGGDADRASVCDWLHERREAIDRQLLATGGVLIRGFTALRDAADFQAALNATGATLMDYVGGTSPRKQVAGSIVTATEVPGTYSIPMHQEMSYTDGAPARIAFFCETPPHEGGETTVGDMRALTRDIDAGVRERFRAAGGLQLCRNLPLPEHVHSRPGVPKPWTEVFATTDRDEAGRQATARGWRWEWHADGLMRLWQEVRAPMRRHPATGDEVWHNQVHIFAPAAALAWARKDGRTEMAERIAAARREAPELLDRFVFAGGSEIADDDALHLYETFERHAAPVRWERSDVLILDNILAAHGRRRFSGARRVLAGLIAQGA